MSLHEFYGGFAMGILMGGVMGCRTHGGFMRFSAGFKNWFYDGFMGFACGFSQPAPAHPAIM